VATGCCEAYAPAGIIEEADSQLALRLRDLPAKRRLRYAQGFCGVRDVLTFGHHRKISKLL
jgi:hypothetical protein